MSIIYPNIGQKFEKFIEFKSTLLNNKNSFFIDLKLQKTLFNFDIVKFDINILSFRIQTYNLIFYHENKDFSSGTKDAQIILTYFKKKKPISNTLNFPYYRKEEMKKYDQFETARGLFGFHPNLKQFSKTNLDNSDILLRTPEVSSRFTFEGTIHFTAWNYS